MLRRLTQLMVLGLLVQSVSACRRTQAIAPPNFLAEVPNSAIMVLGVQWSQLRTSNVFRQLRQGSEWQQYRDRCGFDLLESAQNSVLSTLPDQSWILQSQITQPQSRLEQCFTSLTSRTLPYAVSPLPPIAGHQVYRISSPARATPLVASVLPNGLIIGTVASLTEALPVRSNVALSAFNGTSLRAAYDSLGMNPTVFFLIDGPAMRATMPPIPTEGPALGSFSFAQGLQLYNSVQSVAYGAIITDQQSTLALALRLQTNEQAEQTRSLLASVYRSSIASLRAQNLLPGLIEDLNRQQSIPASQTTALQRAVDALLDRPRFSAQGTITRVEVTTTAEENTLFSSTLTTVLQHSLNRAMPTRIPNQH